MLVASRIMGAANTSIAVSNPLESHAEVGLRWRINAKKTAHVRSPVSIKAVAFTSSAIRPIRRPAFQSMAHAGIVSSSSLASSCRWYTGSIESAAMAASASHVPRGDGRERSVVNAQTRISSPHTR